MERIGKRLLLSAGIGLGVAVSGVSLYLLLRPEDEDLIVKDSDKRKIRQSTQTMISIRVPKQFIGAVIGRGGEHIKQIQNDTKTRIQFDDTNGTIGTNSTDNGLKEMRILLIKGQPESCLAAESVINGIIAEQSRISTKKFNVDTTAIGLIIGRNGDNIRNLCVKSGAKIKVDRNTKKSNSIMTSIWITGNEEQIDEAVLLIDKEIAQNQNFSRNRSHNYNQTNRLTNPKLCAIEDSTNNALDFDNYCAKLEPINEHQMIEVFVSAVKSPNQFYVQIAGAGAQQLDHLMEETTDFYEIEDNRICFKPKTIKVGDIVAVPYQFDEHWYRAKVVSIEETPYSLEESKVGVFYMDFGDEAIIQYKQICDLKDELLRRLPFQAMDCSLSGVAPKLVTDWSEEATDKFKELSHMALWKTLYAKVIDIKLINDKKEKYFIELYDRNPNINTNSITSNHTKSDDWDESPKPQALNIGQELISRDLAVPLSSDSTDGSLP